MKVFVTGATGLLGSNLVRKLVLLGEQVSVLVREGSNNPLLDELSIQKFEGELNDSKFLEEKMENCDVVYHLAAKISFNKNEYDELYRTNVLGTRNVLQAAMNAGVKKVVHASSAATIGTPSKNKSLLNENDTFPENQKKPGYPYSKWLAEQEVFNFCKKGLNISIANFSSIYGKGEKSFNAGTIIKIIYTLPIRLIISPPGSCSVISVDDAVDGLIAISKQGKKGERYILTGENMSYYQLFNTVARIVKNSRIKFAFPRFTMTPAVFTAGILEKMSYLTGVSSKLLTEELVKNLFLNRYLDNSKAIKELSWKPKVPFETSVKDAFDFYKQQKML